MRILYLGSTDLPQTKARAIQIVHTCHALARAGAEVTLVGGRRGGGSAADVLKQYGLATHPGLRLLRLPILRIPPNAPPRVLAQFTRAWQASYLAGLAAALPLEMALRKPDVIFARDLRTAKLAIAPALAVDARLAFEVHGLPSYEVTHGAGRANLPASEAGRLRALEETVFRNANRIVTITECARQLLFTSYGVPYERTRTVADGTAVARGMGRWPSPPTPLPVRGRGATASYGDFSSRSSSEQDPSTGSPSPAHRERGSGGEGRPVRPTIYYVGQLYPWKGAGLVVEVAARVPEADVVIVGGQTNWTQDDPDIAQLAARAEELGVRERVQLRGHVPYERVPDELAQATVALLPLPDEPVARLFTSPLKLFDYMAAGVAIVASDLPAIREVLRHNHNALLASPGDPESFAIAVRRLIANPELAQRLGRQARADVNQYSWDARAEALLDFLAEPPLPPVLSGASDDPQ